MFGQPAGNAMGIAPDYAIWTNRHVMIAFTTMMWMAEVLGYDTAPMEGFFETRGSPCSTSLMACEWLRCSASADARDPTSLMRAASK